MRKSERKNTNKSICKIDMKQEDFVTIEILPDGTVLLPRNANMPFLLDIAKALGDEKAITFCEQATLTKVLLGKPLCG